MIQVPVEPKATEYLHNKASRLGIPLNGTFELTPCCNMNCRMCYVRMDPAQQAAIGPLRTAQQWLALGRQARDQGMLYLLLTGGEPFLHPEFRQIMEGLHQLGLVISINSNATLIDEQVVSWLKKCPPSRINITLYGASDETYGRLCRNPRGFTQVTRAIRLLREAGIAVKINCSVTPYNAGDLDEIFAYCRRENLIIQATSYMFPPLRRDAGMVGKNDRFTPEEAAYYAARIQMLYNGKEAYMERYRSRQLQPFPEVPGDDCLEETGEGVRCRAGRCCFWVTWNGRMLPCGMMQPGLALDAFADFAAAWQRAKAVVAEITLPAKCAVCGLKEDCKACAAMVYTESGCFDKVPEYRCQMTQAYAQQSRRLAEEIEREEAGHEA